MRVFLGNGPWRPEGRLGVRAGSRWPFTVPAQPGQKVPVYLPFPFFLAYAAAVLEQDVNEVLLVDAIATGETEEEFLRRMERFSPRLVVLETSTPSFDVDMALARRAKRRLGKGAQVALCGPHVSFYLEQVLRDYPDVDYVLVGEYEYTLRDLVRAVQEEKPLREVEGLVFRDGAEIVANPRRPVISNLDELPRPAYHFLPMRNYNDDFQVLPKPNVQMWSSRGCPFQCIFCMWPQLMYGNHQYRVRSPERVAEEMEWLIKTYDFKAVYFDDDTFNIGKDRILKLCAEIEKRDVRVPWAIMARADTMTHEMLEAMKDAGLCALKFGVESGVQEIVLSAGKNLDLELVRKNAQLTKELGIHLHLTFTFGLPGETRETIRRTIQFARELEPDSVQFSIVTPFPGTKYFHELEASGKLQVRKWADFDGARRAVFRSDTVSQEELEAAVHEAYGYFPPKKSRVVVRAVASAEPARAELRSGKLRLAFCDGKVDLWWGEQKLTDGDSFHITLREGKNECRSFTDAAWKILQLSDKELVADGEWTSLPIGQLWEIRVEGQETIRFRITLTPRDRVSLDLGELTGQFRAEYWQWDNSAKRGGFAPLASPDKGAWAGRPAQGYVGLDSWNNALPSIKFGASERYFYLRANISSPNSCGRVLSYLRFATERGNLLPREHLFFEGTLSLVPASKGSFFHNSFPAEPRKILVINSASGGQLSQLASSLRSQAEGRQIEFYFGAPAPDPSVLEVAANCRVLDSELFSARRAWRPLRVLNVVRQVRRGRYDAVLLNLAQELQSGQRAKKVLAHLSGAKHKLQMDGSGEITKLDLIRKIWRRGSQGIIRRLVMMFTGFFSILFLVGLTGYFSGLFVAKKVRACFK